MSETDSEQAHREVQQGIGQHASDVRSQAGPPEPGAEQDLAAQAVASGAGATDVDVPTLLAYIKQMSERVEALEEEKRTSHAPPLLATIESLGALLREHASKSVVAADHAPVLALADDLADAGKNAVESGDLTHVKSIGEKISKWLNRNHPGPGDHHYFRQAVDFAGPHLADAVDSFEAQPRRAPAPELGSSRPPAKVVAGSVTG